MYVNCFFFTHVYHVPDNLVVWPSIFATPSTALVLAKIRKLKKMQALMRIGNQGNSMLMKVHRFSLITLHQQMYERPRITYNYFHN